MTRTLKKKLKAVNFNKEVQVSIRKEHRTEFLCGATAPARIRTHRSSVATDRYVAAEIADNNYPFDGMEIDDSITERENVSEFANQVPEFSTQGYSALQLQNLALFAGIPSVARSPAQFLDFHRHRDSRRVQHVSQAANTRSPFIDEYLENVPRMFEIAPQAAHVEFPLMTADLVNENTFNVRQNENTSMRAPAISYAFAMRAPAVSETIAGRNLFEQMSQAASFGIASVRAPVVSEPIAGRNLFEQVPQAARLDSASMRSLTNSNSYAVNRPPMPGLIPLALREPQAGMPNNSNVPNLLDAPHGFLNYVERAVKQCKKNEHQ